MNKAQKYLLNAGISDIVVHGGESKDPKDWKYLSDVLSDFHLTTHSSKTAESCPKGGNHEWGLHSNEFCKKCFDPRP